MQQKAAVVNADYIYTRYSPSLYGYILSVTGNEVVACELLAKCFVYACHHLQYYDNTKLSLFSWLMQIAFKQLREKDAMAVKNENTFLPDTGMLQQK